jgi:hypothetical protein
MASESGTVSRWSGDALWPTPRRVPQVVVLSGINRSGIVDAALADSALTEAVVLRLEPDCAPPCDATLWRLETANGEALNATGNLQRHWHRRPYAMTVRLVCHYPGATEPKVLDEGTLGTKVPADAFAASVDRLAMRMVRDGVLERSRGRSGRAPAERPWGLPGWMDRMRTRWHERLTTEWWSIGRSAITLEQLVSGQELGAVRWHTTDPGAAYLADPFPWIEGGAILCEEMPLVNGTGRIVAVSDAGEAATVLDDGRHHSYPCTFVSDGITYCVPEATDRGATRIYRLGPDGVLTDPVVAAPHARLADPTLFAWGDRFWLACTDLDLGTHDNLCLLHAAQIEGPWLPHAKWPVKIDVRGSRPAGSLFVIGQRLYRPAQDCAATYGAAVTLHEVEVLTETAFVETLVGVVKPDPAGPFPDGLHTLVSDGRHTWVDGKRFVFDTGTVGNKIAGRLRRLAKP